MKCNLSVLLNLSPQVAQEKQEPGKGCEAEAERKSLHEEFMLML